MTKKNVYPSKKTLNLCIKEKSQFDPVKVIPLVVLLILAVAAFAKFGVIDRIQKTNRIESELASLRHERDSLVTSLTKYDEIAAEYNRYSVGWMTANEKTLVKRSDALDLVENMLMKKSGVQNIQIKGNLVSVTLTGVDLDDTSRFVEALYARDDVENVVVYNASTKTDKTDYAAVSMVITMKVAEEGGADK